MPIKYRVVTRPSGKAWSVWRDTREEALEDAVQCELAERDDNDPSSIWLDPLVEIEEQNVLSEHEIWACAIEVHRQHGDDAIAFAGKRIDALIQAGDVPGVCT